MNHPTVGATVCYTPHENQNIAEKHLTATVAHVHSDECVNLMVVAPGGKTFNKTSVRFFQGDEKRPASGGFCQWPPTAKETAKQDAADIKEAKAEAKADAAEAKQEAKDDAAQAKQDAKDEAAEHKAHRR